MLQVCFGDSVKGSLRYAQVCGQSSRIGGCVSVISSEPLSDAERRAQEQAYEAELLLREKDAVPLGGCREDLVNVDFALSLGDIAAPPPSAARKQLLTQWLTADPWGDFGEEAAASAAQYWEAVCADFGVLCTRAGAGEAVRIWCDSTPNAQCGLCFVCAALEHYDCAVTLLTPPPAGTLPKPYASAAHWGDIPPEFYGRLAAEERPLTPQQRSALAQCWARLQNENAPLRATVNGQLLSVPVTFYDDFIRACIPAEPFAKARLIGLVLGKYCLGIGDWFVSTRISALVDAGELRVVTPDARPYAVELERA